MDNILLTSSSQISPNTGNPLNPPLPEPATTSTIESIISSPLEPVGQENTDGSLQTHIDVNYQPHDVALASVKTNDQNGFKVSEHHKMDMGDNDSEHPDKSKSCCSMLNKLFLALAIVCFALFLCSIAYIIVNLEGLNYKYDRRVLSKADNSFGMHDGLPLSEIYLNETYINLTHPDNNGIIVVLSRRGASVHDILLPYKDTNGVKQYRSIVIQGGNENHFGSVRFGFADPSNSMNMKYQLPSNYPFLNVYNEDWPMYGDINKPYRIRFVQHLTQIIYEFSSTNPDELLMKIMVATPSDGQIIADPTNNIYFNLRSHGDLSTHNLNLSSSNPIEILNSQKIEEDQLNQPQRVDKLSNINKNFYKFNRAGIGKNYIATLSESETETTMHVFSDHTGVMIDPTGDGFSNANVNHATTIPDMRGIRISPRQSPVYQRTSIYGPTLVVYPSQSIHTTWWQFQYRK